MNANRSRLAMNILLTPEALRRVLLSGQLQLPLTHMRALEVTARLHGYKTWNAAAASATDVHGLKQRAVALRTLRSTTDSDLSAVCTAMDAVVLAASDVGSVSSLPPDLTSQEREILGFLGAGASTAELRELVSADRRDLDWTLIRLGPKIHHLSRPNRDAFAREHGLVLRMHVTRLITLRAKRPRPPYVPSNVNLNYAPSVADLQKLFAVQDDERGHHVLTVDRNGWVHLDRLPAETAPNQFHDEIDNEMQCRYETFVQGCGYVGPTAALNTRRMTDLLESMKQHWAEGVAGYVEVF